MSESSLCKGNLSHFRSIFHANISSKLLSKNLRTVSARSPNTLPSSTIFSRAYAVRPPPPSAETPSTTVFTGPSQPRPYHANHPMPRRRRELPTIPVRFFTVRFRAFSLMVSFILVIAAPLAPSARILNRWSRWLGHILNLRHQPRKNLLFCSQVYHACGTE